MKYRIVKEIGVISGDIKYYVEQGSKKWFLFWKWETVKSPDDWLGENLAIAIRNAVRASQLIAFNAATLADDRIYQHPEKEKLYPYFEDGFNSKKEAEEALLFLRKHNEHKIKQVL